jgi:tRNA threonylcarbamoyladenosine biosynthesis protein TsaE
MTRIMETQTYDITNIVDLALAAGVVLEHARVLAKKDPDVATVIALSGDLGAGKTTFVQSIAESLGVTDSVTSPTFVVMKQYETQNDTFTELVHIDAYRIDDADEMRPLGFTALLMRPEILMCIEWAERIESLLPPQTIAITLTQHHDGTRTLIINS